MAVSERKIHRNLTILWTKKVVQKCSKKWSIGGVFSMVSKNVQNRPKKWSIGPVLDQLEKA